MLGWVSLSRVGSISAVDLVFWLLRVSVPAAVALGTARTIMSNPYSAEQWVDFIVFGLTIGGVYALIALGYTMVYGILRLINFAHGEIMMLGAFAGFFTIRHFDQTGFLETWPVAALAIVCAAAMGASAGAALLVERICYRPFRHVGSLAPLICAIGASFVLQHSARGAFGSSVRSYPNPDWLEGAIVLFGASIPVVQAVVIAAALIAMVGLWLFVQTTRLGISMRAVSEDPDAAALMGIDVTRVIVLTFLVGGSLAGLGAVLYCLVFNQVHFFMGFVPGLKAFSAAVLGGIGNIPGAMLGGFLLGLVESVGPALFLEGLGVPAPYQLKDLIAFTVLVMVLLFLPRGLLGERLAKTRA